ncbi:unnamed protein product [Euphydryas editha]|uniref:CCHC-type domain-containing protein n=1 Tax=Euphydryas editha TaxID=104508 RepID=A0AAU9VCI2_EUPED|nr:unnamed protein product [Euphydryas editha]
MTMTKILLCLPQEYKHFISSWKSVQSSQQTIKNLTARLLVEEERLQINGNRERTTEAFVANKSNKSRYRRELPKKDFLTNNASDSGIKCYNCGKYGHFKNQCNSRQCNYCGKKGHLYNDC